MADLVVSPQVFSILTSLIEERVGLSYSLSEKPIFDVKASTRAVDAGFASMLDYYYFLRYDDPEQHEFQALVEALLVHETFFFRELDSLKVAVEKLLAPRIHERSGPGRARVWSAACSTGEEPLTLAMLLAENDLSDKVELLASDLSEAALQRARSGCYSPRALRLRPDQRLTQRYLETRDNQLVAAPALLASIDFRRLNLTDDLTSLGMFDLIVCRNVLIYFGDSCARKVVAQLASLLLPGGALLIGVSESLLRLGTTLVCEEHAGVFIYRKPKTA